MMAFLAFMKKLALRLFYASWFIMSYTRMKTRANLRVSLDILRKKPRLQPAIVAYPLEADTNLEVFLLSTLLTMIPATLSVDISGDGRCLYIHGLYVEDEAEFIRDVKETLELPVRRFCR